MYQWETTVLLQPEREELRFLPEGPYRVGDSMVSWVAIQHATDQPRGSLNLLDLESGRNQEFSLPGRPGFAFPTSREGVFIIGLERAIVLFDTHDQSFHSVVDGIDQDVQGTIINDGLVYRGHLVFGCKDVAFQDKKAGLYLMRAGEQRVVRLRTDQICSNGKAIACGADGELTLYDIDSPTQQITAARLDLDAGTLSDQRVVVDLTSGSVFPDGMILTPDNKSLIVALYDPRDSTFGEAHQYAIATGQREAVWRCAASPRVTCPQLIRRAGRIELLLTTADEGMSPEMRAKAHDAGCLFVGPTNFTDLNDAPLYKLTQG